MDKDALEPLKIALRTFKGVRLAAWIGVAVATGGIATIPALIFESVEVLIEKIIEDGFIELCGEVVTKVVIDGETMYQIGENTTELLTQEQTEEWIADSLKNLRLDQSEKFLNIVQADLVLGSVAVNAGKLIEEINNKLEKTREEYSKLKQIKDVRLFNSQLKKLEDKLYKDIMNLPLTAKTRDECLETFNALKQVEVAYRSVGYDWFMEKDFKVFRGKFEHYSSVFKQECRRNLLAAGIDLDQLSPVYQVIKI